MIQIGAEITTNGAALTQQLNRDADAIERSLGGAFSAVASAGLAPVRVIGDISSRVGRLIGRVTSLRTLVSGLAITLVARSALRQIDDAITGAGQLEVQLDGLANISGKTRGQINLLLGDVNDASAGLLDMSVAAEVTGRALLAGIPESAIAQITEYSARIAVARGEADRFEQQLPQLFKTIAGGETGLLKDFGVFIDPADLQGIDFAERNARILDLTLDQLQAKSERLGTTGDELFFRYTGIFGSIDDIRRSVSGWVIENETVIASVEAVSDVAAGIADQLRRDDPGDVMAALFERLLQIAGAAAADIGEAIAIGITRGIRGGLELLGADFADILPADLAERAEAFGDRDIDASRTRQRFGELRGDVTGPTPERVGSEELSPAQVREIRREVSRLGLELDRAEPGGDIAIELQQQIVDQSRRAGLPLNPERDDRIREIEREIAGLRDAGQDAPEGLADELRRLRSDRASDNRQGGELRRLARQLATGEGRELGQARLAERRADLRAGVTRRELDTEDIERRAREALEERRDEIILNIGLGDPRTIDERTDDTTGIDEDDNLLQRVGKAISSGLATEAQGLREQLISAFDEGATVGAAVITGNVAEWGADIAAGALRAASEFDWTPIAESIFRGIIDQDWADLGTQAGNAMLDAFLSLLPEPILNAINNTADATTALLDNDPNIGAAVDAAAAGRAADAVDRAAGAAQDIAPAAANAVLDVSDAAAGDGVINGVADNVFTPAAEAVASLTRGVGELLGFFDDFQERVDESRDIADQITAEQDRRDGLEIALPPPPTPFRPPIDQPSDTAQEDFDRLVDLSTRQVAPPPPASRADDDQPQSDDSEAPDAPPTENRDAAEAARRAQQAEADLAAALDQQAEQAERMTAAALEIVAGNAQAAEAMEEAARALA